VILVDDPVQFYERLFISEWNGGASGEPPCPGIKTIFALDEYDGALEFSGVWNESRRRASSITLEFFIRAEEVEFIGNDWTAEGRSPGGFFKYIVESGDWVFSASVFVFKEVLNRPGEVVGAAFGYGVDGCSGEARLARVVGRNFDRDFVDRVHRNRIGESGAAV